MKKTGLSPGRLSQLLDEDLPFGDVAARNLEQRLQLDPGYFDSLDERTLRFALAFEALPAHQKDAWERIVSVLRQPPERD